MKKLFCAATILLMVIFCACGNSGEPKDLFGIPMRITAQLKGGSASFCADIFAEGCDIVFEGEYALSGTVLRFRNDKSTATAGNFTREIKKGTFPAQEAFVKAVRALAYTEISGIKTENGMKYTIDEMTIMVYYNEDTETVTGIGTEEDGRRFEFTVMSLEPYEAQSNGAGQP